jgi:ribosomal protein S18 acetylase RimI-like enzyme
MAEQPLAEKRRAIRTLLDEAAATDAPAAYYALHHPDSRTRLEIYPPGSREPTGYLALSRTGIDLFRPLLTLRLPAGDPEGAAALIYGGLAPGTNLFIHAPAGYRPLLNAFFQFQTEQTLALYRLDRRHFQEEVNVLVVRSPTPDGLPRFIVRPTGPATEGEIGASAAVNWQSPRFADISVYTNPQYRQRGWGKSVVTALARYLLEQGRTPLYQVEKHNQASIGLARRVGFVDTTADKLLLEATLRPRP